MSFKFNDFLNDLPTTKVRVLVSLGMSVYVVVMAVTKSYTPTMEILGFLLVQMGIDVTQYMARQKTVVNTLGTPTPTDTPTPDVSPTPTPTVKPAVPAVPQIKPSDLG